MIERFLPFILFEEVSIAPSIALGKPMATQCPYCESTRTLLIGNVFCSRHHSDMGSMESGTLFIRSEKLEETADHVSRLSIRMMLDGAQWYNVGGVDRALHKNNFPVIDQGQNYRTAFQSENGAPMEMAVVAFKPGSAGEVWRSMACTPEELLDDPNRPVDRIGFFEHTTRRTSSCDPRSFVCMPW